MLTIDKNNYIGDEAVEEKEARRQLTIEESLEFQDQYIMNKPKQGDN